MFHLTHTRFPIGNEPHLTRTTSIATARAESPSPPNASIAAPLTLASVVAATLLLAVTAALISALGA